MSSSNKPEVVPAANFIRNIVEADLAAGKHGQRRWAGHPGPATDHAGTHLSSIEFGTFESSSLCGLAATISDPAHRQLDGNSLWLEYNPAVGTWTCSSSVDDRYLPPACRG